MGPAPLAELGQVVSEPDHLLGSGELAFEPTHLLLGLQLTRRGGAPVTLDCLGVLGDGLEVGLVLLLRRGAGEGSGGRTRVGESALGVPLGDDAQGAGDGTARLLQGLGRVLVDNALLVDVGAHGTERTERRLTRLGAELLVLAQAATSAA